MRYSKAHFSKSKIYRYYLERRWGGKSSLMVIGLNPSTADAIKNDPTVTRCINFAKTWGYGGLYMMNLFAIRSTDPKGMFTHPKPIGIENDKWLVKIACRSRLILCAWGNHGFHLDRDISVQELLKNKKLYCLEKNVTGTPKHPLYCKADLLPKPYTVF